MDLNCRNITNINRNIDKNLFIKNLSRELVNTLNGLDGFLSLIDKNEMSDRDKELLSQAKYASFILSHQVKSLNYIQESESKRPRLNCIGFNLRDMLLNSLIYFKNNFDKKDLEILFNYDENIRQILYGDSLKLNEIINSLLENIFILVAGKINLIIEEKALEKELTVISFNLLFDSKYFSLEFFNDFQEVVYESLSQKNDIKKVDINFALSEELLRQMNGSLVLSKENNRYKFTFDIPFYLQAYED